MSKVLIVPHAYAYQPLETVRSALQIPEHTSELRGEIYAGGRRQAYPRIAPLLRDREAASDPPAEDVDYAERMAVYLNEQTGSELVSLPDTVGNPLWTRKQHFFILHTLGVAGTALHRAEQKHILPMDTRQDERFLHQVSAEFMVGRALMQVQPIIDWPEPTLYFNPSEIVALKTEFQPPRVSNTFFASSLANTGTRKYLARRLLRLASQRKGASFSDIYSDFQNELGHNA